MDLVVIAQIITGTATLIVAMVLLYQLRQQHKDAEIQISMMSETLMKGYLILAILIKNITK